MTCEYIEWEWSSDVGGLADVRYVILEQHGGVEIPAAIRAAIRPENEAALRDHVNQMRDTGAPELASAVLNHVPGGVVIHVTLARGLVDTKRRPTPALDRHGHRGRSPGTVTGDRASFPWSPGSPGTEHLSHGHRGHRGQSIFPAH